MKKGVFLFLFLFLLFACFVPRGEAFCFSGPHAAPTRYVLAFDTSRSIGSAQRRIWNSQAVEFLKCVGLGDRVQVLEINAHTLQAVSVWDNGIASAPAGASLTVLVQARAKASRVKGELSDAIAKLLAAPGVAQETDIFGVFGRVNRDASRQTIVIIWSDLLNSVGPPNFERTHIEAGQFFQIIQSLAERFGWTRNSLAGVRVAFVLPSPHGAYAQTPPNNWLTLKSFFTTLVGSLGGQVHQFDSDLRIEGRR